MMILTKISVSCSLVLVLIFGLVQMGKAFDFNQPLEESSFSESRFSVDEKPEVPVNIASLEETVIRLGKYHNIANWTEYFKSGQSSGTRIGNDKIRKLVQASVATLMERINKLPTKSTSSSTSVSTEVPESVKSMVSKAYNAVHVLEKEVNDLKSKAEKLKEKAKYDCGEPKIENGQVAYTSTARGSEARYSCNKGFVFCGDNNLAWCSHYGNWFGTPRACKQSIWNKPASPFTLEMPCRLKYGSVIRIKGTPVKNTKFVVSLLSQTNLVLSISVVFRADGFYKNVVFRSDLVKAVKKSDFPFELGKSFEMEIKLSFQTIEISAEKMTWSYPLTQSSASIKTLKTETGQDTWNVSSVEVEL